MAQGISWYLVATGDLAIAHQFHGLIPEHAGQGSVLRGGFVMGGGFWRVRGLTLSCTAIWLR